MQRRTLWSYRLLALTLLGFAGAVLVSPRDAQAREITKLHIDRATITKGYTVVHRDGAIRFAVTPDQVDQEVNVTIKDAAIYRTPLPAGKRAVSPFFTYDMLGLERNPIIVRRPSWIAVRFSTDNPGADKALYNWDDTKNTWVRMQSAVHPSGEVRGITVLPYSRVVVLEDVGTYQGGASWFSDVRDRVAASNDFPIGTQLAVTNVATGASVTVTVVSNGPFVPGRVIDLSDDAFAALAPLGTGVIQVRVEPPVPDPVGDAGAETVNISSPVGLVVNAANGDVLWGKGGHSVRSIASLTKLMTALLILERQVPFDRVMTIESGDQASGGRLYVRPGEQLTVKDLFYATLVGSANNASLALARSSGLSRPAFVRAMNDRAKQLGMTHTTFADPSGLDPRNTSTARDYALLAKAALGHYTMLQGTTTREYVFRTVGGVEHRIRSTNELLASSLYITGGKTGYLDEAGYCLMTKARDTEGHEVIAIVLGSPDSATRFRETEQLLRWGLDQL